MNSIFRAGRANSAEIRQLASIHSAGQTDIRDEEIDPRVRLQHAQRAGSVCSFYRRIAEFGQHFRNQHPNRRFVIDDEDCFALGSSS